MVPWTFRYMKSFGGDTKTISMPLTKDKANSISKP